jgi:hypothetical protein
MNIASMIVTFIIASLFVAAVWYSVRSRGCPNCHHSTDNGHCAHCYASYSNHEK